MTELVRRLDAPGRVDRSKAFGFEAPLRICPLGAHIDHQGGRVTGMTVDRSVVMAAAPTAGSICAIESLDFPGRVEVDLCLPQGPREGNWGDYLRAAVVALGSEERLDRGLRGVIAGDLAGAGLSSSAATLLVYLSSIARVNGIDLAPDRLAELVRRAENEYVGVASGLLDPSVMVHARPQSLTVIDCLDGAFEGVVSPARAARFSVIVAFSGVTRSLAASGFNTRVSECTEAAARLLELAGSSAGGGPRLRDVDRGLFDAYSLELPQHLRLRARHFFDEMDRVDAGVDAWRRADLRGFGELVNASGESSIVNYECGIPPLVSLLELLRSQPGVFGARFSGGGFGGACVALAAPDACDDLVAAVRTAYSAAYPRLADAAAIAVCRSSGPLRQLEVDP
jgi:galactokinase/galacturonokinase